LRRRERQHEYESDFVGTVEFASDGHVQIYYWVSTGGQFALSLWPRTVAEAVDVLCALGVLPAELSSIWRAAYAREEWRICIRKEPYMMHPLLYGKAASRAEATADLDEARKYYETPWVEMRRVGYTNWERVPDAQ
jgi:hypothetical protein